MRGPCHVGGTSFNVGTNVCRRLSLLALRVDVGRTGVPDTGPGTGSGRDGRCVGSPGEWKEREERVGRQVRPEQRHDQRPHHRLFQQRPGRLEQRSPRHHQEQRRVRLDVEVHAVHRRLHVREGRQEAQLVRPYAVSELVVEENPSAVSVVSGLFGRAGPQEVLVAPAPSSDADDVPAPCRPSSCASRPGGRSDDVFRVPGLSGEGGRWFGRGARVGFASPSPPGRSPIPGTSLPTTLVSEVSLPCRRRSRTQSAGCGHGWVDVGTRLWTWVDAAQVGSCRACTTSQREGRGRDTERGSSRFVVMAGVEFCSEGSPGVLSVSRALGDRFGVKFIRWSSGPRSPWCRRPRPYVSGTTARDANPCPSCKTCYFPLAQEVWGGEGGARFRTLL